MFPVQILNLVTALAIGMVTLTENRIQIKFLTRGTFSLVGKQNKKYRCANTNTSTH